MLAANDPQVVAKRLGMHPDRLTERLAQQERTVRFLERLIDQGVPLMSYEITVKATGVAPDHEVHEIERQGELVASTVHRGRYDEVGPAYHVLAEWIQEHGHQIAGPGREVYLNDPDQVPADELLTEVQWPIEREA